MDISTRSATNTFKDLRTASVPSKRNKTRNKKYYNFQTVKPGQLNIPHYERDVANSRNYLWAAPWPAVIKSCPVVKLSKKQLYDEAKANAPSYSLPTCWCCRPRSGWNGRSAHRLAKSVKEEAFEWGRYGYHADLIGKRTTMDRINWDELAEDDVELEWRWDWNGEDENGESRYGSENSPRSGVDDGLPDASYGFNPLNAQAIELRKEEIRLEIEGLGWTVIGDDSSESETNWSAWTDDDFSSDEEFEMV